MDMMNDETPDSWLYVQLREAPLWLLLRDPSRPRQDVDTFLEAASRISDRQAHLWDATAGTLSLTNSSTPTGNTKRQAVTSVAQDLILRSPAWYSALLRHHTDRNEACVCVVIGADYVLSPTSLRDGGAGCIRDVIHRLREVQAAAAAATTTAQSSSRHNTDMDSPQQLKPRIGCVLLGPSAPLPEKKHAALTAPEEMTSQRRGAVPSQLPSAQQQQQRAPPLTPPPPSTAISDQATFPSVVLDSMNWFDESQYMQNSLHEMEHGLHVLAEVMRFIAGVEDRNSSIDGMNADYTDKAGSIPQSLAGYVEAYRMATTNLPINKVDVGNTLDALRTAMLSIYEDDAVQGKINSIFDVAAVPDSNDKKQPISRPIESAGQHTKRDRLRSIQMIIPGLWCGSFAPANDLSFMKAIGITHICCCMDVSEFKFPDVFVYMKVPICDNMDANMRPFLSETYDFIENAMMGRGGRGAVLVHCGAGISRAPTVVAAYLIRKFGLSASTAMALVKAKRPFANPNANFCQQLVEYAASLGITDTADTSQRGRRKPTL